MTYELIPIQVTPGVQPTTDFTPQSTPHYTLSDKIRFVDGLPEKIGGWDIFTIDSGDTVSGCSRGFFSYVLGTRIQTIIGTHLNLYSLIGSQLVNITPLVTSTTAIANSLDTLFGTLANDPLTTVLGSATITVADTSATRLVAGDTISLAGATATGGIPAIEINADHIVRSAGSTSFTISVATSATSSTSGGGAAVVRATAIMNVNQTAHGFSEGDRVKILAATATGGIPAGEINAEHVIRGVVTDDYDIVATTLATSSVTGGGGASTTVQEQIPDGNCDSTLGQGYGAGLYGVGLYGVSKISSTNAVPPRLYSFDKFGTLSVLTPGVQTGLYSWAGDTVTAPALVTNAPTAINYTFVSNNICVTLGSGGVVNRIKWCDQGNLTTWTTTAENQAGEDDIEDAGEFISHVKVRGINLLFTSEQVHTFRYIRKPFVWETKLLDPDRGIIGPNARISVNGIAYWMGQNNFYMYRGGNAEIIPSNSTKQTTIKKIGFENLNEAQADKIFCWYNDKFEEIWWHYPSGSSNEPDKIARLNIKDFTWAPDTLDRTAAEYPNALLQFHRLIDIDGVIHRHENGADDDGSILTWSLTGPFAASGTDVVRIGAIIPDSIQLSDITLNVNAKQYPQSSDVDAKGPFTITTTTERTTPMNISARYVQYILTGGVLAQTWRGGTWLQEIQRSSRRG